jgi:glycosyltransferase involved in cell wall biosynthesis
VEPTSARSRLRIAFVYDALVPFCNGGAERRYFELATRLAARHEVHYVTWRYWGPEPTLVRDGVTLHGIGAPRPFYGPDGRRNLREMAEFARRLPGALARLDVDVVDVSATPFLPVYAAWLATRWSGTPLVATWHEYWGDHWLTYLPNRPVLSRLARLAEATARPFADRRVAVSAFTARRMAGDTGGGAGAGGTDRSRPGGSGIDVVPNGVDLAALSVPPGSRRSDIVFVGRLIAEKRVDLLIGAVAEVARTRPAVSCLVVGDGPEREALAALTARLGVEGNVAFLGRVDAHELPRLMAASKVFVLPSDREGYGITVVEAQAASLVPIVTRSELSAAPHLVRPGIDGLVVEPTVAAIAEAIGGLLDDPAGRTAMAAAARRSASARGWDDRVAEMEGIYADLVAGRRRSAFDREPTRAPASATRRAPASAAREADTAGTVS